MTGSQDFEIVCPNNHNQTMTFTSKQFDQELKSDSLVFHCNTCETNWTPSRADIDRIRKRLSESDQ